MQAIKRLRGTSRGFSPVAAFPETPGAVVQRTVLSGDLPARLVVHDSGNDWCVGDGSTTLTFRVRLSSRTRRM